MLHLIKPILISFILWQPVPMVPYLMMEQSFVPIDEIHQILKAMELIARSA